KSAVAAPRISALTRSVRRSAVTTSEARSRTTKSRSVKLRTPAAPYAIHRSVRSRGSEETTSRDRTLLWIAYGAAGVLSFTLLLLVVRDLASLVVTADLRTERVSALILGAATALFLLGYVRAHHGVALRRVTVPIEN